MPTLYSGEDRYDALISAEAVRSGLPFGLIKAFVAAESQFDAAATRGEPQRNDSSFGLMQILGANATALGLKEPVNALLRPEVGLRYGVDWLKKTLGSATWPSGYEKRPYNLLEGIAAYNMGWPRPIQATTAYIASIYGYPVDYAKHPPPGWRFANQPYVDKVMTLSVFYDAKHRGDEATATAAADAFRRRDLRRYEGTLPAGVLYDRPGVLALRAWAVRGYGTAPAEGGGSLVALAAVALALWHFRDSIKGLLGRLT